MLSFIRSVLIIIAVVVVLAIEEFIPLRHQHSIRQLEGGEFNEGGDEERKRDKDTSL